MTASELRYELERRGLTIADLARLCGLARPRVSEYANGRVPITTRTAALLREGLAKAGERA